MSNTPVVQQPGWVTLIAESLGEDENTLQCARYVEMREVMGGTVGAVADQLGMAKATLYRRIQLWERSGLLEQIRKVMLSFLVEEKKVAELRVLGEWNGLLEQVVKDAKDALDPMKRLAIMSWLNTHVIKPTVADKEEPGSAETNFIAAMITRKVKFDPTKLDSSVDTDN